MAKKAGRTVGGVTYTLVYDAENRLQQVKQGSTVLASYTYDADGNRVKADFGGSVTVYVGACYEKMTSGSRASPVDQPIPRHPEIHDTRNLAVAYFSIVKWPGLSSSNGPVFNYQPLHPSSTTGPIFDHHLAYFSFDKNSPQIIAVILGEIRATAPNSFTGWPTE